jgi:hypothetical protein
MILKRLALVGGFIVALSGCSTPYIDSLTHDTAAALRSLVTS